MYLFMVSGIALLVFIIHYVYTTTVRKVSTHHMHMHTHTHARREIEHVCVTLTVHDCMGFI